MKIRRKILPAIFAILLLAAGCGKQRVDVGKSDDRQASNRQIQNEAASSTNSNSPSGRTQTRQNAGSPDYQPGYITVAQTVEASNLNQPYNKIKEGQTALDLLKATHQVEVKSYSFGDMVTGIDGNKSDAKHFWEFFVNGKSSNVGAGSYQLKDGDKIEWKLSEINGYK